MLNSAVLEALGELSDRERQVVRLLTAKSPALVAEAKAVLRAGLETASWITVVDTGGWDPDARGLRARRLGLTSMHERAASIGGRLTIDSTPGEGAVVELRFPA